MRPRRSTGPAAEEQRETQVWCRFGGTSFSLSGPADLLEATRRWLGLRRWLAAPPPRGAIAVSMSPAGRANNRVRWHAPSLGSYESDPAAAIAQLEYQMAVKAMARSRMPAALHAGTLLLPGDDGALLVTGAHATGKTSLSVALTTQGFRLLADDVAFIGRAARVRPLERPLRIREKSMALLGPVAQQIAARSLLARDRHVYYASLALFAGEPREQRRDPRVRHIVFARFRRGAKSEIRPIDPSRAVALALELTFAVRRRDMRLVHAIIDLCARARAWSFRYGASPLEAAAFLSEAIVE